MWRIGLMVVLSLVAVSAHQPQLPPPVEWDPTIDPVWRNPAPIVGSPAVSGDEAFGLLEGHRLVKLSAADGSEIWRVPTQEFGATYGRRVVIAEAAVLVGEYNVVAIDRDTGRHQWTFAPAAGYAPGPYLGEVADGTAYAGSGSGHLYAIDVTTGRPRWAQLVDARQESTVYAPQVRGDLVIAGFTEFVTPLRGGIVALERETGRQRWRFDFPSDEVSMNFTSGSLVVGDEVIGSSGDGRICGLDPEGGALRWSLPAVSGPLTSIIPPSRQDIRALDADGQTLVAGSNTGYIIGYDLATREERWRFPGGLLGSTGFEVAILNGTVYVPYVSGFLVALDATTGKMRWRTDDWQQGFMWVPTVWNTRLIVGSRLGVWALRTEPGGDR
jgi:outer membrane protein assembly factor BamB